MVEEFRILSPTGILGYSFPLESFNEGLARQPDLFACDAGSTDPGPYYLGSGKCFTTRSAVKRDLSLLLTSACKMRKPLVIGSAGGSGAKPHLDRELEIIAEISQEQELTFNLAVISADFDKEFLLQEFKNGHIKRLGATPELIEKDIIDSTYIVGQMGIEPIIEAVDHGAQVILCGRCYDPAVFAAPAIRLGYDKALAIHLGKILECAAIAADPGSGADCMMGYLGDGYFRVEPLNPERKCTPLSVSAHTLYEKSNPYLLPGPGGILDLSDCQFIADSDRCVRVKGSKYQSSPIYTVKLEAARKLGFRTISICGNRDPIFISKIEEILMAVKQQVNCNLPPKTNYHLEFIVYGKNGVMGDLEPINEIISHEVGIAIDAVADTQELANTVCSIARSTLLHYGYPGRLATAGNLAFPFSPSDVEVGAVYSFSIYHLLETNQPVELFKREYKTIVKGREM